MTGIREFGRLLVVTTLGDDQEQRVRSDYERFKAERFPGWPGEPEIVLSSPCECGRPGCRLTGSGWLASVPEEYVR